MKCHLITAAVISTGFAGSAFGQYVNFTGNYFQDFNGLGTSGVEQISGQGPHAIQGVLGSTGMEGWYGANPGGSASNTQFRAHDGSLAGSDGRGVVFYGAVGSNNRALGALPTSNQVPAFGVVLQNTTGNTFTSLDVSFLGQQWRAGGANIPNVLAFSYGYGNSINDATIGFNALDFAAPFTAGGEFALDGTDSANQTALSAVITSLNWAPGEFLVLRWDLADLPGQDNGLAIDNLLLVGNIPAPGALALLGLAGLVSASRRRR